jgi:hypothetical protein
MHSQRGQTGPFDQPKRDELGRSLDLREVPDGLKEIARQPLRRAHQGGPYYVSAQASSVSTRSEEVMRQILYDGTD